MDKIVRLGKVKRNSPIFFFIVAKKLKSFAYSIRNLRLRNIINLKLLYNVIASIVVFFIISFLMIKLEGEFKVFYVTAFQINRINFAQDVSSINNKTPVVNDKSNNVKVNSVLIKVDTRAYILDRYFASRNSPLVGKGNVFVAACDKYGAPKDCIVVAAIARHETDLCKYANSAEMYNCWGFGGPAEYRTKFSSFEDSVDHVTEILVQQYGIKYMIDPRLMEEVFCGPDPECEGWGSRILYFMRDLDDFSVSLGYGRLTDFNDPVFRY